MESTTSEVKNASPMFAVVESSPRLLDSHAKFLEDGGERLLVAMVDTIQSGTSWPWATPSDQSAQYGAFVAGFSLATRILRNLNVLTRNRRELGKLVAEATPGAETSEMKKILIRDYGYTEADFEKREEN